MNEGRDIAAQVEQVLQSERLTRLLDRSPIQRVVRGVSLALQATVSGDVVLKAGMTHTVEPGNYHPGIGGFLIEDDVLLTQEVAEVLGYF